MSELYDIHSLIWQYIGWFRYPGNSWYVLLSSVVLALISYTYYYYKSKGFSIVGFLRYLFPKSLYSHRSTKLDIKYMLSFPIIAGVIFKPALAFGTSWPTYKGGYWLLENLFGAQTITVPESWWLVGALTLAFTVISAMAADLMFYFHHYLLHKVSFLWEFHKVHHSAEVLTPLVDFRAHPLELLTYGSARGIGTGAALALINYATGGQIHVYTVLGLNAIYITYIVMGYPLRHSHVWISYGPILSRIFISPAQHQIHHSKAERHWDKNLGGAFALWDWMFGTLYIPQQKEKLIYGLAEEKNEYSSVTNLYLQPFRNNAGSRIGFIVVMMLIAFFLFFASKQLLQTATRLVG